MKTKILFWLSVILLISVPTFWRLMRPGFFKMHDDLQVIRVYEMTKCLKDFQIPCRWVPDMGYRYGYPQFNFYGPLPYYIMSFINLLGVNLFDSVKIGFILPTILGNITMLLLGISLFGGVGGIIATILYAYMPYRASDTYIRGAIGEVWAFVFLPLIILSIRNLIKNPTLKNSAILAISFACLIATHNVTTLIFTPLALVYVVFLVIHKNKTNLSHIFLDLKKYFFSFLWGGVMAGFFMLPVLFEKKFAHTETMIGGYFDYRAHFVSLKQMFLTSFWGTGSSEIGPADDMSFFFSPVLLVLIFASLIFFVRKISKKKISEIDFTFAIFIFLGLISSFMIHEKSSFVWSLVPTLEYLQFPWRFLLVANFFFILGIGYLFNRLRLKENITIVVSIFLVSFLFSVSFFMPVMLKDLSIEEKMSGNFWDKQMTISIYDYLPTSAQTPPTSPAPVYPSSSTRYYSITNFRKGTNWYRFEYLSSEDSVITLNQLDYPGWQIKVDNKIVSHNHNQDGLITFEVGSGKSTIFAKLNDTPVRLIGNVTSLVTISLAIFIFIKKDHVSKS